MKAAGLVILMVENWAWMMVDLKANIVNRGNRSQCSGFFSVELSNEIIM